MLHGKEYRHKVAQWAAVLLLVLVGQGFAATYNVWGPKTYVRSTREPVTVSESFSARPSGQYTLRVVNGGNQEQYRMASSAVISLNGVVIVREDEWNPHTVVIDKPVTLQKSNLISVQLRSDIGAGISVQILGIDNDPPTISASISPAPNAAGWNNTPVTVTFTCNDASTDVTCTAPVNVNTEGANQVVIGTATDAAGLSTSLSVRLNLDFTAPTISASFTPAPNSNGWNSSDVTINFSCGDSLSGVASCPAPVTVSAEGVQQISGTVFDNAGNQAQAVASVSLDKTPPTVTVSSPANGAVVSSSQLQVSGTVSDTLSGVASVLCNGAPASFGGGAFNCTLTLSGGSNNVQVVALDSAGNSTDDPISVTFNSAPQPAPALQPPPAQMAITPTGISMLVGERRAVSAVDNLGRNLPATWSVDNTSILTLRNDGSMVAVAPGTATVTATYQQLTAQEQIMVSAGPSLGMGSQRWELQPVDVNNDWINNYVPAQPTAPGAPDLYVLEGTATASMVRALAADGHQLWSTPLLPSSITSGSTFMYDSEGLQAGTPEGGLVVLDRQVFYNGAAYSSQYSVVKVDPTAQAVAWRYDSPGPLDSAWAVHPNGDIYVLQTSSSGAAAAANVVVLNGATGQVKAAIPLPLSSQTYNDTAYNQSQALVCQPGQTVTVQSAPNRGSLAVLPDGNLYVEVDTTNTVLQGCQSGGGFLMASYLNSLQLAKLQTSGAYSFMPLEQFTDSVMQPSGQPGQVIPDGQGGVLVGWDKLVTGSSSNQAWVSHVINGTQTDYALPWTSNYPIDFAMVLAEGGTAFAQNGSFSGQVVAFDINSGSQTGNYNSTVQILSALAGGGVMVANNSQIFTLDASGNTAVLSNTLNLWTPLYFAASTWLGYANDGSLAAAVGPSLQTGVTSWPVIAGNFAQQQAPPVPALRHFLPTQPSGQYSVAQFESSMQQAAPALNHVFYGLSQASVDSFLEQLDKPNDAVAFLGNSLEYDFNGSVQSIGLCFYSDCLEKTPSASDPSYALVSPAGYTSSLIDAYVLEGKTKVVFVASADSGAVFQELWGIDATSPHQALIVPPNSTVSLQQAAQVWVAIAQGLASGQTVQDAVNAANTQFGTAWMVVGDGSVRIKAVQ